MSSLFGIGWTRCLGGLIALSLAGCPSSGGGTIEFDAGLPPPVDSGLPPVDSGALEPDLAVPPGGFALSVQSATVTSMIGGTSAPAGRRFLKLAVTLRNVTDPNPLSTSIAFFSVTTKAAINVLASGRTALVMSPCAADLRAAAGGAIACNIVFEIPEGDSGVTLLYKDERSRETSAAIPAAPVIFDRRAGGYPIVGMSTIQKNTCKSLHYDLPPGLTLVTRGEDITFQEVSGTIPMVGNQGVLMKPQRMGADLLCQWLVTETITVRFTADGEFEYTTDAALDNFSGMFCFDKMACQTSISATYRRMP